MTQARDAQDEDSFNHFQADDTVAHPARSAVLNRKRRGWQEK